MIHLKQVEAKEIDPITPKFDQRPPTKNKQKIPTIP